MSVAEINPGEEKVALGFIEEAEPWVLRSKYFPSKVGGQPAWLALDNLPTHNQLSCQVCSDPLTFLCQLYLPDSRHDYSFHRTIFLFVCHNGGCCIPNTSKGIKAFRCQLPRRNPYYSYEPPVEEEATSASPSAADYGSVCCICAARADKVCSQCHRISYCSKSHQSLHWKFGHKNECKKLAAGSGPSSVFAARTSLLFPEAEIILEPQENASSESDDDDAELTDDQIRERLAQFSDAQIVAGAHDDPYSIDTLENVATADADPVFTAFKEQMDKHPEQVIRYHRGGAPLFCAQQPKPVRGKRHNCPHCSRPRTFEFQVMPQMLDHLKLDVVEGPSLDWGVLLVFTCNCDVKFGYVEELVFKQDYAECQEKAPSQQ